MECVCIYIYTVYMSASVRQTVFEGVSSSTNPSTWAAFPLCWSIISPHNCNRLTSGECDTKLTLDWFPKNHPWLAHKHSSPRFASHVSHKSFCVFVFLYSKWSYLREFIKSFFLIMSQQMFSLCVWFCSNTQTFFFQRKWNYLKSSIKLKWIIYLDLAMRHSNTQTF